MILTVNGMKFHYPGRPVIDDASFSVEKGELLAVLGTNGTGKTTLLKVINRILRPAAGVVLIGKDPVSELSRNDLAKRIGQQAKETVRQKFLVIRILKDYLDLLNELLA